MTDTDHRPTAVPIELRVEIEQFLFDEARLLDDGEFERWFELLADDISYFAPIRSDRLPRERDRSQTTHGQLAHFDEDKRSLRWRVRRLSTGMAWAEDPPSRTRHHVSNIQIRPTAVETEFEVRSYSLVYRNRVDVETDVWSMRRDDVLRRSGASWQIARRFILLDQNVITARNLSVFF